MHSPNLQQVPRGSDSEVQKWVKECFITQPGKVFWERDYSAIEAVLVGYFAGSSNYVRFAKLGVHAYLASHIIGNPADLGWSDGDLRAYFKVLKGAHPTEYDTAKRIVHGSNYMMTPRKMCYEYPETFPTVKAAAALQGLYFDLFPEIKEWHKDLCLRVDGTKRRTGQDGEGVDPWTLGVCYARNPFGYVHRFYNVLDWEKIDGKWEWTYGEDAKRLVSFLPQSTAAGIIKRATKLLWANHRDVVGESLRLLIHDSIFGETGQDHSEECLSISKGVMESPILECPLDPDWGMGSHLTVGTEGKVGSCWGTMKGVN